MMCLFTRHTFTCFGLPDAITLYFGGLAGESEQSEVRILTIASILVQNYDIMFIQY